MISHTSVIIGFFSFNRISFHNLPSFTILTILFSLDNGILYNLLFAIERIYEINELFDWLSKAFWMTATKLLHMFYHNKAWLEQSYLFNNKQTNLMIIKIWKVFIYCRTLYAYAIIIQTKHMNEVDYIKKNKDKIK